MKLSLNTPAVSPNEARLTPDISRLNPDVHNSKNADRQGQSDWGQQLVLLLVGIGFMGSLAALMGYLVAAA
jgi:hypothetical protein